MTSEHSYLDYLEDILDAIEKVTQFIEGMTYEEFVGDAKTVFAVIRALEIVGEATKQLPQSVRDNYPEVPWREMAGIRDKLIHEYFGVNLVVVWKTAVVDLSGLESAIRRILAESNVQ
jgi:uncharacterized protein with HEPN domain